MLEIHALDLVLQSHNIYSFIYLFQNVNYTLKLLIDIYDDTDLAIHNNSQYYSESMVTD